MKIKEVFRPKPHMRQYLLGRIEREKEIIELIDKEIRYFDKPDMEFKEEMVFYLEDLKRRIKEGAE